ncbi:hypothetical protein LUZ60_001852 [Juncus effusus]|nr:hypothetical protein LUZ60_001852 [Juncus effusus]
MPSLKRGMTILAQGSQDSPYSDIFSSLRDMSGASKEIKEVDDKISWVRAQLIGENLEFDTPFGRRRLTYADHTASGRSLKYIENYIVQDVLPFYGNTHTEDSCVGSKTSRTIQEASSYIKRCMGAGANDVLLFCGSGTSGAIKRLQEFMGIFVPSILKDRITQTLKEEERWVVFTGPYEHHSNLLSWRNSTAEVVEIGLDETGLIDLDELRNEIASLKYMNRPMLGSFSACSNVTGIVSDTRAIARVLHSHGAFACFDFAASGPYEEIHMRSGELDGYDAIFLSPHKFVGGPGTPGVLLLNKSLYMLGSSAPSACGGGTVAYVNGFNEKDTLYYDDIEKREDFGTPPIIQTVRAALVFWVKEFVGHEVINLYEEAFASSAMRRLLNHPNIVILGNTGVHRLPIFSFLVYPGSSSSATFSNNDKGKPLHGRFAAKLLNDLFGIQARGGCACAGPYGHHLLDVDKELSLCIRSSIEQGYNGIKPGWTRISFCYYMSKEEFGFILSCVEFIATYGHLFLPLYNFDWVTGDWIFRKRTLKYHLLSQELDIFTSHDTIYKEKNTRNIEKETKEEKIMEQKFESYLENARRITLSLYESSMPYHGLPKDVDPRLALFRL